MRSNDAPNEFVPNRVDGGGAVLPFYIIFTSPWGAKLQHLQSSQPRCRSTTKSTEETRRRCGGGGYCNCHYVLSVMSSKKHKQIRNVEYSPNTEWVFTPPPSLFAAAHSLCSLTRAAAAAGWRLPLAVWCSVG